MNTATLTPSARVLRPSPRSRVEKTTSVFVRVPKKSEDPYQGFSKQDYEYLCKVAALRKAGKLKLVERELPEV